jgi:hypothetical protein
MPAWIQNAKGKAYIKDKKTAGQNSGILEQN